MNFFRQRSVLLTGASGGIGAALSRELVARGASVLGVARRAPPLAALEAALAQAPGRFLPLAADITSARERERIAVAAAGLPGAPVLVHAAAIGGFGLFEQRDDEDARRLFDTNVLAPVALTRRLLPQLEASGRGLVVAIGSTFGSVGFPGFAEYSASKFALRGLVEALAREYRARPVRFLWLSPRATQTDFNSEAVDALNRELGTRVDRPERVAVQLADAIARGRPRMQIGFPERLVVRLNGAFPELVDRALAPAAGHVRRHAPAPASSHPAVETTP